MPAAHARSGDISLAERLVILLCALPTAMIFTILTPVLPRLGEALGGPGQGVMVRLVLTIVGFSMAMGSPLGGWLVERLGVKRVVIGAASLWIVVGCLQSFAGDLRVLLIMRFVEGGTAAALMVAGASLLGRLPSELARGSMAGWQTMIATLVAMATLVIAGMLGDIDWRYTFQLHLLALPVVIAALGLPSSAVAGREARGRSGEFWRRFPYGLTALGFFLGMVAFAVTTYAPFLFHDVGLEKPSALGLALTASAFTTALFSVLFGVMRRRMSAKLVFVVPILAAAVGATLAGIAPNYGLMIAALLLFGAGMGPLLPNLYAILMGAPDADRAPIFGVVKGLYYGSAFVGGLVLEPVMRAAGPRGVVLTLAGLLVAIAVAVMLFYGRSAWTRSEEGLSATRP